MGLNLRAAVVLATLLALVVSCGGGSSAVQRRADEAVLVPVLQPEAPAGPDVAPAPAPAIVQEAAAPAGVPQQQVKKVVVLDPGHGGDEVGSANNGVVEKHSNLDFALRVEKILLAKGVDVYLTRRTDARAAPAVPGFTTTRSDLQARLDAANAVKGDVFVSIHSNGSTDGGLNGVEAWFDSSWVYAEQGKRLAGLLVSHVLSELRGYGYTALDRGLYDGKCFRQREGRCFTLFVIAGPRETSREEVVRRGGDPAQLGFGDAPSIYSRPAAMPSALVELLFTTYARDAAVLRDEAGRQAMARGVAGAILAFLGIPDGG
jgi:N-acetylmuramoyl-L-alanine amidase